MNRHELNKVSGVVQAAVKAVHDNEKFLIGVLAAQANRVAAQHPHDQTVVGFSGFLTKRASTKNVSLFITRAELNDVYHKLYTPNNKLAQHFSHELGLVEETKTNIMRRDSNEGSTNLVDDAYNKIVDPLLSEQLESAFSRESHKPYSNAAAQDAQKACARELNSCGVLPKEVKVEAGQADILICRATYDTPCGQTSVLVPVEVRNEQAL